MLLRYFQPEAVMEGLLAFKKTRSNGPAIKARVRSGFSAMGKNGSLEKVLQHSHKHVIYKVHSRDWFFPRLR